MVSDSEPLTAPFFVFYKLYLKFTLIHGAVQQHNTLHCRRVPWDSVQCPTIKCSLSAFYHSPMQQSPSVCCSVNGTHNVGNNCFVRVLAVTDILQCTKMPVTAHCVNSA